MSKMSANRRTSFQDKGAADTMIIDVLGDVDTLKQMVAPTMEDTDGKAVAAFNAIADDIGQAGEAKSTAIEKPSAENQKKFKESMDRLSRSISNFSASVDKALKDANQKYSVEAAAQGRIFGQVSKATAVLNNASELTSLGLSAEGTATRLFTADANAILTPMTVYTTNANGWWGFAGGELTVSSTNSSRAIDGSGWIPVNLNAISSGAPISNYPVDPVNTGTSTQYIYTASTTVFKLAAQMESSKYGSQTGSGNVTIGDGGNSTSTFEAGTNLTGL